ncbi:hypothetical protein C8T65DRAFT_63696 [Cerioporus squamosus]|nr:hypothetical protein C8T65DRAFT_63696 [Cerioporus squamosus]
MSMSLISTAGVCIPQVIPKVDHNYVLLASSHPRSQKGRYSSVRCIQSLPAIRKSCIRFKLTFACRPHQVLTANSFSPCLGGVDLFRVNSVPKDNGQVVLGAPSLPSVTSPSNSRSQSGQGTPSRCHQNRSRAPLPASAPTSDLVSLLLAAHSISGTNGTPRLPLRVISNSYTHQQRCSHSKMLPCIPQTVARSLSPDPPRLPAIGPRPRRPSYNRQQALQLVSHPVGISQPAVSRGRSVSARSPHSPICRSSSLSRNAEIPVAFAKPPLPPGVRTARSTRPLSP